MIVRIVVQVILYRLLTGFHGDLPVVTPPCLSNTRNTFTDHSLSASAFERRACVSRVWEFQAWDIACATRRRVMQCQSGRTTYNSLQGCVVGYRLLLATVALVTQ
jgi:hypothetical protein